jgi:hypothetical protein
MLMIFSYNPMIVDYEFLIFLFNPIIHGDIFLDGHNQVFIDAVG